jgi:hypothetical protein
MKISKSGGWCKFERNAAAANRVIASDASQRVSLRAVRKGRWVDPVFDVLKKTPSRRDMPSMQARAVIQLADRLMMRDITARRREIVVQCRRVHVIQIVATIMSDIGSRDLSPPSGMSAKLEPETKSPAMTSSKSVNPNIKRSRNHPREAMR